MRVVDVSLLQKLENFILCNYCFVRVGFIFKKIMEFSIKVGCRRKLARIAGRSCKESVIIIIIVAFVIVVVVVELVLFVWLLRSRI